MTQTWYPNAVRIPGPSGKIRPGTNQGLGIVAHSAVGYRPGIRAVIANTKQPEGFTFAVMQDGTVEQYYPLEARLNHSGDVWCNDNTWGIEHEGGAVGNETEALTPKQLRASIDLVRWLSTRGGWELSRNGNHRSIPRKTLWEHREVADRPTACPSGRIPWSYYFPPVQSDRSPVQDTPTPYILPAPFGRTDWAKAYTRGATPIRREPVSPGYVDDVYEVRIRRKVR